MKYKYCELFLNYSENLDNNYLNIIHEYDLDYKELEYILSIIEFTEEEVALSFSISFAIMLLT